MKAFIATIALVSSVTVSAATGTITVTASGNNTVVRIQNAAAESLYNSLTNAQEVSTQQGSLTKTKRIGRDVECVRDAAIVISYSCGLKIDDTGAVVK